MVSPLKHNEAIDALDNKQIIAAYRELRTRRDAAKKEFIASQAPTLELMRDFECVLLARMTEADTTTINNTAGRAVRSTKRSMTTKDSRAFLGWVREGNHYDLLDVRPLKSEVTAYMEDSPDHGLPPGLHLVQEYQVAIQAPTKKPK